MAWHFNETVRCGNSTARVKNYYPDTGLIVLMDIQGEFEKGMTITGDESGQSLTLSNFVIAPEYDWFYDPTYWSDPQFNGLSIIDGVVYDEGSGQWVALEEHFTGKPNQDYQTTYLVVVD